MSYTIKSRYVIIAILIALTGLFFLGWSIGHKRANNASNQTIDSLKYVIKAYVIRINAKDLYVTEVEQELTTQKEAIRKGEVERAELKALHLKAVNEVTFLKGQVKILKDSIAHTGNVIIVTPCDSITDGKPAIELPFTFKEVNDNYNLYGGFNSQGKMSIDLTVPIALDVWVGKDSKTKEYKAVVTSENPVVQITGVQSLKMDVPKVRKIGIGFHVGYGFSLKQATPTPYIGIGVSWNLIRF